MSENDMQQWANILRGRGAFYEFFALVFSKPADKEILDIVAQFAPHFKMVAEETGIGELKIGADKLAQFVDTIAEDEEYLNELNRNFTSTFLLGGASVPTSESVYRSQEHLLKQEPWEKVMEYYRDNQFGIPVSIKEPEDHVSIECLFMYFLANKCAEAIDDNNSQQADELVNTQARFMHEHPLLWFPAFCDRVLAKSENYLFLTAITMLLKGFIAYDKDFLLDVSTEYKV